MRNKPLELKMAEPDDYEGGWTLDYDMLGEVSNRLSEQDEITELSMEDIEAVLCAFFGLELSDHE